MPLKKHVEGHAPQPPCAADEGKLWSIRTPHLGEALEQSLPTPAHICGMLSSLVLSLSCLNLLDTTQSTAQHHAKLRVKALHTVY
jgi:hypothetical protein